MRVYDGDELDSQWRYVDHLCATHMRLLCGVGVSEWAMDRNNECNIASSGTFRQKLDRIVTNDTSGKKGKSPKVSDKRDMLASCINRHNDAIKWDVWKMFKVKRNNIINKSTTLRYTVLIEGAYTWSFILIIGFGMIMMVAIVLEVSVETNYRRSSELTDKLSANIDYSQQKIS